jgi:DNA-binding transcriptional MerR regulator
MAEILSIGQVAARTRLSVHALRYYESEGLMANPVGRSGGRRVYTEDDVDWINLCVLMRASGMPIPVLRSYTELVRQGDGNERVRLQLLQEHRAAVIDQIAELTRCLDLITFKVGIYEDILEAAGSNAAAPAGDRVESVAGRECV